MEESVAKWLDVSRTPVREALRRLESEDVLARGTQGLVVVEIGEEELLELYDLRERLEEMAASFAARNASAADRKRLRRVLAEEEACDPRDAATLASINREFHRVLAAAAHNRYLVKTMNGLQDVFLRLRSTVFSLPGRPRLALEEHRGIVQAIERRDAPAAARAARLHIRASRRSRVRLQGGSTNTLPRARGQPAGISFERSRPRNAYGVGSPSAGRLRGERE